VTRQSLGCEEGKAGSVLETWERASIRFMLAVKLDELYGQAFEDFFQRMMSAQYPSFVPVRTHGNIGDLSADGLTLHDRKLYACYGAEVNDPEGVRSKLLRDLAGALTKRPAEFDTFVFVHNDRRGVRPEVSRALSEARDMYEKLAFENFGFPRFHIELCQMERWLIEDLLGPFPASPVTTGVILEDLLPLLDHLASHRRQVEELPPIPKPSVEKLDYNEFFADTKRDLKNALPYVQHVETYYAGRLDPTERDATAAGFRDYYDMVTPDSDGPDDVLWQLERHILGNEVPTRQQQLNALVILMYFFGECDIFKVPPPGWSHVSQQKVVL
jgi:hypothetical protein